MSHIAFERDKVLRLAPGTKDNAIHETSMHDSQYGKAEGISTERRA